MPFKKQKQLIIAFMVGAAIAPTVSWAEQESIDARMDRLERIVQGQGLSSLLTQVDQLQREIQRLNGANEELNHKIEQMQQRQREQYLDLDKRLVEAEQSAVPVTPQPAADDSASMASEAAGAELADTESSASTPAEQDGIDSLAPVAIESGEAAYQAALQDLRGGRYQEALTALNAFPQNYPGSSYLPNVYYWKGEAHYVLREFDQAIVAFEKVLTDYAGSSKVADALLKRGFSEYEVGNSEKAQATLNQVLQQYPDTSASRLAQVRLDRIQQSAQ